MSIRSIAIVGVLMSASLTFGQTGPEVGAKIPAFVVQDQTGAERDFASLTGPNGLLLLFHRSADW